MSAIYGIVAGGRIIIATLGSGLIPVLAGSQLNWNVYIILCSDDTLYTGITTDIERRMRQHAEGQGAKYFRGRQPKRLLYLETGHDRSSAGKREIFIKALSRKEKHLLVASLAEAPPQETPSSPRPSP